MHEGINSKRQEGKKVKFKGHESKLRQGETKEKKKKKVKSIECKNKQCQQIKKNETVKIK